ncbi:hypothetical protein LCGC14_2919980 [marine sediment metagenome]|uniref:Uncharacterized protein n=1 Tax=marine sediment metagenome TaxID=412755 RepID=A0A0F8YAY9_9ZZZZ
MDDGVAADHLREEIGKLYDPEWLKNHIKRERVEEVQEAAEHACEKCHLGLMVRLAKLRAGLKAAALLQTKRDKDEECNG